MGIDISRFRLFCFGLAGGLGAITGIVTAPITFTGYEIGLLNGLKGLVVAIVGGWSIVGTVLAALALGLLEGFCAGFISPGLKDVFSLLVMMVFLILSTYRFSGRGAAHEAGTSLIGLLAVALVVLPFVIPSRYVIGVMCFVAIYGALALGKGVLLEQAGIFSLAHPAWFGIGAYVTGIAAVKGLSPPRDHPAGRRVRGPACLCHGGTASSAQRVLPGLCHLLAPLDHRDRHRQPGSLPAAMTGSWAFRLSPWGCFSLEGDRPFYYLSWGLCLGTLWFLNNLMDSRVGRAIKSFNDSETASTSMGINVAAYKLRMFVITAVLASLAGSISLLLDPLHHARPLRVSLLVELITMIIIGGGKTLYGPLLGSFVVMWLRELIHTYLGKMLPVMTAEVDAALFRGHHRGYPHLYARRAGRVAGTVVSMPEGGSRGAPRLIGCSRSKM